MRLAVGATIMAPANRLSQICDPLVNALMPLRHYGSLARHRAYVSGNYSGRFMNAIQYVYCISAPKSPLRGCVHYGMPSAPACAAEMER